MREIKWRIGSNLIAANQNRLALERAFERRHIIYAQNIIDLYTKLVVYKKNSIFEV